MTSIDITTPTLRHADRFFIGGEWVAASSSSTIDVMDSTTGELCLSVAEAQPADMDRAIAAARTAFDDGPWPRMTHAARAEYLRAFANAWRARVDSIRHFYPREAGALDSLAGRFTERAALEYEYYGSLADTFPFEEQVQPTAGGEFGLLVREPVGVVGAIIPWNGPVGSISHKIAPALISGCTIILKSSPEAPAEGLMAAEIAEEIGLPAGVLNVVAADREVSEMLVTDPRVDKISFTGSTVAGRRIASLLGDRIGRYSLELGGKSAAVVLDDADIATAGATLAAAECMLAGQVCSSLTRIVVVRSRYDELVESLASSFAGVVVGDPYHADTQMGPLVSERQRARVEGYIAKGKSEGARLVTGGGRPAHLDRGYYVEPTVFADVDNSHTIAREEIFGPVLSVIPATDEADAVRIANDTIFGLNASVFTEDVDRARAVAREMRSGTVGHNALRMDFGIAFGGFKQSGVGREGGTEGLRQYLETKTVILDGPPADYRN
ncbi:aldehyde dehydrogenase [Rhodococcus sp. NPDC127530]|uniref:aldehyde dehydrogenase n=1 Tax=unclassified Rhodococcus (in: high G+C Gram-positive bacteria) TaxID=192944 RepID=UPI003632BEF1